MTFAEDRGGKYSLIEFPASMIHMLDTCFTGTDCRSGAYYNDKAVGEGERLACNAIKSLLFKARGESVVIPALPGLEGVKQMTFHFDDASVSIPGEYDKYLSIGEEHVPTLCDLLRATALHECQIEAIRDFLFRKAQINPRESGSLCSLMEAHHCYNTFIFGKLDIENIVARFVEQYTATYITTKVTEEHMNMLKSMMTAYYRQWKKMKDQIHEIESKKSADAISKDVIKNYGKGGITGVKLGVIGYEIFSAALQGEVTHLVGAASALKVSEATGLHLVGTSVTLVSNVAVGMAISGGLSLFGIFMLAKTIKREVEHLRLLDEKRDTIKYLKMYPNTVMRRASVSALKMPITEQLYCKDFNLPGCAAIPGSLTEGCWGYKRRSEGSKSHFVADEITYEVCQPIFS
jgi:hypothetical protein